MSTDSPYNSLEEIAAFHERVAKTVRPAANGRPAARPLRVFDLDGNILVGYDTVDGKPLAEGLPANQNIPFDADVDALVKEGKVKRVILALKGMDVRLPKDISDELKQMVANDDQFGAVILTSRGMEAATDILRASGIDHPEKLAFFADSGATAYINGKRVDTYILNPEERQFLDGLKGLHLDDKIDQKLTELGIDPAGRPELYIEKNNIDYTIHWRETVQGHCGQEEGGKVDVEIGKVVDEAVQEYIKKSSPITADGKKTFAGEVAPCAFKVKIANIDKGVGMKTIVEQAEANGVNPSALLYYGDDYAKREDGIVKPGTDYHAAKVGPTLAKERGIPFFAIHTLHPKNKELIEDTSADPQLVIANDDKIVRPMTNQAEFPHTPHIAITTNSPVMTGKMLKDGRALEAARLARPDLLPQAAATGRA